MTHEEYLQFREEMVQSIYSIATRAGLNTLIDRIFWMGWHKRDDEGHGEEVQA